MHYQKTYNIFETYQNNPEHSCLMNREFTKSKEKGQNKNNKLASPKVLLLHAKHRQKIRFLKKILTRCTLDKQFGGVIIMSPDTQLDKYNFDADFKGYANGITCMSDRN